MLCTRSLQITWHCSGEIPCDEHLDINPRRGFLFAVTIQSILSARHQPDLGITAVSEPKDTYSLDIMISTSDLRNQRGTKYSLRGTTWLFFFSFFFSSTFPKTRLIIQVSFHYTDLALKQFVWRHMWISNLGHFHIATNCFYHMKQLCN